MSQAEFALTYVFTLAFSATKIDLFITTFILSN